MRVSSVIDPSVLLNKKHALISRMKVLLFLIPQGNIKVHSEKDIGVL